MTDLYAFAGEDGQWMNLLQSPFERRAFKMTDRDVHIGEEFGKFFKYTVVGSDVAAKPNDEFKQWLRSNRFSDPAVIFVTTTGPDVQNGYVVRFKTSLAAVLFKMWH